MNKIFLASMMMAALVGTPVAAQTGAKQKSADTKITDAAVKPVKRAKIPPKLKKIQKRPYSLKGLGSCSTIRQEIRELNEVLGPDVNEKPSKSKSEKRKETAGNVGGAVAGSIIPLGGLLGEVTGASASRRRYNKAVFAGTVRRGFLKGVGLERGCKAPARP